MRCPMCHPASHPHFPWLPQPAGRVAAAPVSGQRISSVRMHLKMSNRCETPARGIGPRLPPLGRSLQASCRDHVTAVGRRTCLSRGVLRRSGGPIMFATQGRFSPHRGEDLTLTQRSFRLGPRAIVTSHDLPACQQDQRRRHSISPSLPARESGGIFAL